MNNLKEKINNDFKEAFKQKKAVELSVLKMIKAAIANAEIEKRGKTGESELTDAEVLDVLSREAKKRKDAAEAYEQGNRPELAKNERAEIQILSSYLPAQMSEDEIKELAKKTIAESGAVGAQDFGKVMKIASSQTKGKADGALVSKIVKELLENRT